MNYRDWHVGMNVVCIKRGNWRGIFLDESLPVFGSVYTIRNIELGADGDIYLQFHELRNPRRYDGGMKECQFFAGRFRPVQPRATDISMFTAMLTDTKQKVPAL